MKILLVDDHPLILSALQAMVEAMADDIEVRVAESAQQAHALLDREADVDLVLLDLTLADADGFTTLEELRSRRPELPVVVVSATERAADVVRAIDLGAMGFVPKRTSNTELHGALAMVMSGSVYIPPAVLGLVHLPAGAAQSPAWAGVVAHIGQQRQPDAPATVIAPGAGSSGAWPVAAAQAASLGLTPRQNEVLSLLLKGLPNKLIARELNVSVVTIKDHVAAVLRALGVNSRTQAVLVVS
ncbi:MAG: DNA-binding response regulator, partial [Burkholderiales bacterium PBB5]